MAAQDKHSANQDTYSRRSLKRSHQSKRKAKFRRSLRYVYIRFIRLRSHPREIARGMAAGIFAGSYPLFGVQTIMGVAIAAAIRGNKIVAAAGTWISNPLTYVPIYAFNYRIGRWVLGPSTSADELQSSPQELIQELLNFSSIQELIPELLNLGADIILALMVGSTIVGLILAVIGYYSFLHLAYTLKSNRNNR